MEEVGGVVVAPVEHGGRMVNHSLIRSVIKLQGVRKGYQRIGEVALSKSAGLGFYSKGCRREHGSAHKNVAL